MTISRDNRTVPYAQNVRQCSFAPFHAITQDPIAIFSLIWRTFSWASKSSLIPLCIQSPPSTFTGQPLMFSVPMVLRFPECHIIESIQYTFVCQASFGWHNTFAIHPWCSMYQQPIQLASVSLYDLYHSLFVHTSHLLISTTLVICSIPRRP